MNPITVETIVRADAAKVWQYWNDLAHIVQWAFASDDWEAPSAANDLRVGGTFTTTMAAKDKSASFEFTDAYTIVEESARIAYDMRDDDRLCGARVRPDRAHRASGDPPPRTPDISVVCPG